MHRKWSLQAHGLKVCAWLVALFSEVVETLGGYSLVRRGGSAFEGSICAQPLPLSLFISI
jgi:hypothetical protein